MTWPLWLAGYIAIGFLLDLMCEKECKNQGKEYKNGVKWLCYFVGPVALVVALAMKCLAAFKK